MLKEPEKILVVRTDRMGDVILSTPVISALRRRYPHAYIAFMCRPYTRPLLEGNPGLNEVIECDKSGSHKGFWGTVRFIRALRRTRFDVAIILHPTVRVHLVTFFAGIPRRIGWDKKNSFLLTRKIPHLKQQGEKHESQYTLDILRALGIETREIKPFVPVSEAARMNIAKRLQDKGIKVNEPFIVVHPSASCPSKRWPQEHFVTLVNKIKTGLRLPVVLVTSRDEKEFGGKVAQVPEVIDLRGALELSELIALIEKAALFISNDSGPVHIAASLDVPVISIFGRSDPGLSPERWKPLGEHSVFVHKDVGCPVCFAHDCRKGFLCLESITPQEIFALVEKILAKHKKI
ncbi:MAG: lipopolysaccharide heptosyltransferase II [Candidatus Omnitrophica bacterium]|nr:lipopolysaccharide heptosyltransferase II [Candidatus Omnitrophota bacterium]